MEMSITSEQFTVYSHDQGCRVAKVRVSSSTFNIRERLLQNNSCAHRLDDCTNQDKMNDGTDTTSTPLLPSSWYKSPRESAKVHPTRVVCQDRVSVGVTIHCNDKDYLL
jgi:hypothetical protein